MVFDRRKIASFSPRFGFRWVLPHSVSRACFIEFWREKLDKTDSHIIEFNPIENGVVFDRHKISSSSAWLGVVGFSVGDSRRVSRTCAVGFWREKLRLTEFYIIKSKSAKKVGVVERPHLERLFAWRPLGPSAMTFRI